MDDRALLFRSLMASKGRSTHHKLALDGLQRISGSQAEAWQNLLLSHIDGFLQGAKAPDDRFKDFKNHVLHVNEGLWGGALVATRKWYSKSVELLREERWPDAIFALGVTTHYLSDPYMPFHSGQSEAEGAVHRAAEWSITKSYDALIELLERDLGGRPQCATIMAERWLEQLVEDGARAGYRSYELCIDHYNLARGVKHPPLGLDRAMQEVLARQLGAAAAAITHMLDRAFAECTQAPVCAPPELAPELQTLESSQHWNERVADDGRERRVVAGMYHEFRQRGKCVTTLPEDDRTLRQLHAYEVLRKPLADLDREPARSPGTRTGQPATVSDLELNVMPLTRPQQDAWNWLLSDPARDENVTRDWTPRPSASTPRSPDRHIEPAAREAEPEAERSRRSNRRLTRECPLVDAPSIGPKSAQRMAQFEICTVGDFLDADTLRLAEQLDQRGYDAATLTAWQRQAQLMVETPGLNCRAVQLLVGIGIADRDALSRAQTDQLHQQIKRFARSSDGQRILRDGKSPTAEQVGEWIRCATPPDRNAA